MKFIVIISAGLLAACSTVSEVVPTGKDSYMVGSQARGGLTGDAEVKALAVKRANEFCAAKGQRAQVTNSSSSGTQGWTPQNSEVQFTCVAQ